MFNKKHLTILSETIKEQRKMNGRSVFQLEYDNAVEKLAERLADKLATVDKKFDKSSFLSACLR